MNKRHAQIRKFNLGEVFCIIDGGFQFHDVPFTVKRHNVRKGELFAALARKRFLLLDSGANDIYLPSLGHGFPDEAVQPLSVTLVDGKRADLLSARGHFINGGNIQTAEKHECERSRNGRCAHSKNVAVTALFRKTFSLPRAEAMLLVRYDDTDVFKYYGILYQRVRADEKVNFPRRKSRRYFLFFPPRESRR